MTKTTSLLAALAVALSATTVLAQTTGGSPADPNTNLNQQPGPSVDTADPAAGDSPAARVPTSPPGTGGSASEGASSGDSGAGLEAPAGNPSDPNTNENQQMAPGNINPSDPAAGSDPDARMPTEGAN
jgi:hypothetical protein